MKKIIIIISIIMGFSLFGCGEKPVSEWSDQEIDEWFTSSSWQNELPMKPDSSINTRLFVEQNMLNGTAWEAAFKFLKESDFPKMQEGRYELDENGTFATVTDYITKDFDTAYYESHRKFIDVQYVVSGREYIGLTTLNNIDSVKQEYNESKDIEFFQKSDSKMLLADSTKFFVFFPEDGHKPCLKTDANAIVRKVVVKVPINP